MATNATIYGSISYKDERALLAAIEKLEKGGWIKNGKWSDTLNGPTISALTLFIELAMYRNLSRMFDKDGDTLLLGASSFEIKIDFDGEYLQEIYSDENGDYQSVIMERAIYLHLLGYSKKEIEGATQSGELDWVYEVMEDSVINGFRHLLKDKAA